ncbi:MAG: hypothetical protein ACRDL7_00150 [Gaiellaceae bacterium]
MLPFLLAFAHLTERVLLIHWSKPCALENFLVPPEGGLDWRLRAEDNITDDFLLRNTTSICDKTAKKKGNKTFEACVAKIVANKRARVMPILLTRGDELRRGNAMFENMTHHLTLRTKRTISNEPFLRHFGEIFRLLFEPSEGVARELHNTMTNLNLTAGKFVSAHVRARYSKGNQQLKGKDNENVDLTGGLLFEGENKHRATQWAENAINCAASLAPGLPVYFASDSNDTVSHVLREYDASLDGVSHHHEDNTSLAPLCVVGLEGEEPLHIDYIGFAGKNATEFYSGFVDLLVMGSGRCVAYGMGGYGRFAAALSGGGSFPCIARHRGNDGQMKECEREYTIR